MKIKFFTILLVLIISVGHAVDGQKVMMLKKPGKSKYFFYKTGDKITIQIGEPEFTVQGVITYIDDSVCTVNRDYTFHLSKVNEVIRKRSFLYHSWRTLYVAGFAYATGSMINRAIHDEEPLIDNTIPIVTGSFIVLGTTAYLLRYHHFKKEHGWSLKVLDFDVYKKEFKQQESSREE
jgi:hypothetical protein